MTDAQIQIPAPEILAPAGNRPAFLAALSAGADAIYCGVKEFSARMTAKNFSLRELRVLTELAHDMGKKVYITLNSLLKPDELERAGNLILSLKQHVKPDAIIIQDLALVDLAGQTGYSGEIHLSTLANVSFAQALEAMKPGIPVHRLVLPRELSIDEIKRVSKHRPKGMGLEVFVHGALCYGVSGRCYWSSFLGGKSGLRGRCVQPCRRRYAQRGESQRLFSCRDFSLDVLVKTLRPDPGIQAWKIEGRKKGPHYVYYTVRAYRILRDITPHDQDRNLAKREALALLDYSLGRSGTNYNFLPQRPKNPINTKKQTGSGLFVGTVQGAVKKPYIVPREKLLKGDLLRIGYEDDMWHSMKRINKYVPKKGKLFLKLVPGKNPERGTPVFLIDRCEKELQEMMADLEKRIKPDQHLKALPMELNPNPARGRGKRRKAIDLHVYRIPGKQADAGLTGRWLSPTPQKWSQKTNFFKTWWWLPPVIWPDNEAEFKQTIQLALKKGGRHFVLNSPWQAAFFPQKKNLNLWAGPYCNVANPLAAQVLTSMGFSGVIVSPELGRDDYITMARLCRIPLGVIVSGFWPLCVSRVIADDVLPEASFKSPRGEEAWVKKIGTDHWVFPNWKIDLRKNRTLLRNAGYEMFVHLNEPVPRGIQLKKRPGQWNWNIGLS